MMSAERFSDRLESGASDKLTPLLSQQHGAAATQPITGLPVHILPHNSAKAAVRPPMAIPMHDDDDDDEIIMVMQMCAGHSC
jgi:hypothetical protein